MKSILFLLFSTIFLYYQDCFVSSQGVCNAYVCSSSASKCTSKNGNNIYVNQNACASDEECYISEDDSESHCLKKITYDFPDLLYPGYKCSQSSSSSQCAFGPKYCKNEGICAGVQLYDNCNYNSECYFGMFCNEGGKCVNSKAMGERCTQNEACGRKGMCIFETTLSTYGTCKEILSQSEDSLVLPMYKADMAEVDSGLFVYQSDFEKVCRTGYLNVTSGRCASGLKSKNKGKICTSDFDCPTTDPQKYASCKCGHNAKGTKYCDIEGGDDEWVEAFTKFQSYYERSFDCHSAEGFGSCNNNQYYTDFRCAELRAKLYVDLINVPDCLQSLMRVHPYFYEYYTFCQSYYFSSFISILLTLLMLSLIIF